jgi:Domain of unknown function (DUF4382)/Domain of unknown function (DUF5666)
MMRKSLPFIFIPALSTFLLSGCGSSGAPTCDCPAAPQPVVSMTMTDDPPAGVSVLFFQVSLTAATLTPATGSPVSLLGNITNPTPLQIDVTQLQALSEFLGTASAPAGTYTGLNLTFANPQLVIYNQSDSALGSSCAVGTICTLAPSFDNSSSSLTFTSSPLPVTTSTASPLSFLIDFHLNTVIQPDLSVNLAATNGVTISELPPATPQFGFLVGTVTEVSPSTDQFTMSFPWGGNPIIATTTSTTFNNFPASACTTPGIGCLTQGQIVKVEISGLGGNYLPLTVSQVTYVQQASTQTVEGTIVAIPPLPLPAGETVVDLILHQNPTASASLPLGGMAQVAVWGPGSGSNTPTTFSIDNSGFTIPSGLTFTGASNLTVGQTVQVTVTPGSLTNTGAGPSPSIWGPPPSVSFTASALELEPSQLTGTITATDSGTTSFTLGAAGGTFFAPWPMVSPNAVSFNVLTTGQTTFTGFNPDSFSGLATNDFVSVNGWLFPPATTGPPTIVAQSVLMRPSPVF